MTLIMKETMMDESTATATNGNARCVIKLNGNNGTLLGI